jgi:hypothetical protein
MTMMKASLKIDVPVCGQKVFFLMNFGCMIISYLYAAL